MTSLFTDALIEGLRTGDADDNNDGLVTVDELYDWTYKRVVQRTSAHRPDSFGELRGDIVIAKNPRPRVLPPALLRMIKHDDAQERRHATGWLGSLLAGSDARVVARLATRWTRSARIPGPTWPTRHAPRSVAHAVAHPTDPPKPVDGRVETLQRRGDRHLNERRHAAAVAVYDTRWRRRRISFPRSLVAASRSDACGRSTMPARTSIGLSSCSRRAPRRVSRGRSCRLPAGSRATRSRTSTRRWRRSPTPPNALYGARHRSFASGPSGLRSSARGLRARRPLPIRTIPKRWRGRRSRSPPWVGRRKRSGPGTKRRHAGHGHRRH